MLPTSYHQNFRCCAVVFVVSLLAVQYPFASFLMSHAAQNPFFGTMYLAYGVPATSYLARNQFYITETPAQFAMGIGLAIAIATLSMRLGLSRGKWVSQVQR